jgi:hypothetical protein
MESSLLDSEFWRSLFHVYPIHGPADRATRGAETTGPAWGRTVLIRRDPLVIAIVAHWSQLCDDPGQIVTHR